jgi:hypothetical protein
MLGVRLAVSHTFEDHPQPVSGASPLDLAMLERLARRRCGPKWPEEEARHQPAR